MNSMTENRSLVTQAVVDDGLLGYTGCGKLELSLVTQAVVSWSLAWLHRLW